MRAITLLFVIPLLAALLLGAAGCGRTELPPYAHWMPDGSLEIGVEEADPNASSGATGFNSILGYPEYVIYYDCGDYTQTFAVSTLSAIPSSGGPAVIVSRVVVPGDGVAHFSTAIWRDEAGNMNVDLFMDTDWQDVVQGQLYLLAMDYIEVWDEDGQRDLRPEERDVIPLDLSQSVDGIFYYHVAPFPPATDDFAPVHVLVTNIEGTPLGVLQKWQGLDFRIGQVVASVVGPR